MYLLTGESCVQIVFRYNYIHQKDKFEPFILFSCSLPLNKVSRLMTALGNLGPNDLFFYSYVLSVKYSSLRKCVGKGCEQYFYTVCLFLSLIKDGLNSLNTNHHSIKVYNVILLNVVWARIKN